MFDPTDSPILAFARREEEARLFSMEARTAKRDSPEVPSTSISRRERRTRTTLSRSRRNSLFSTSGGERTDTALLAVTNRRNGTMLDAVVVVVVRPGDDDDGVGVVSIRGYSDMGSGLGDWDWGGERVCNWRGRRAAFERGMTVGMLDGTVRRVRSAISWRSGCWRVRLGLGWHGVIRVRGDWVRRWVSVRGHHAGVIRSRVCHVGRRTREEWGCGGVGCSVWVTLGRALRVREHTRRAVLAHGEVPAKQ